MAEALFEEELDEDFAEKLEETKKLIDEAKNGETDEKTCQMQQETQKNVSEDLKEDEDEIGEKGTNCPGKKTPKSKRGKKKSMKSQRNGEISNGENGADSNDATVGNSGSSPAVVEMDEALPADVLMEETVEPFVIDETELEKCVEQAVERATDWSVPQLEAFGAAISQLVDRFTDKFDRSSLPSDLLSLISGFSP
uniref:Uncharacterized protein n=1 Tax=Panagrolaimus sp. JU765 TaxID=591449 RepID=A0AC34QCE8_9BILA